MKKRRRQKEKRMLVQPSAIRKPGRPPVEEGPTPETKAKLKNDPLLTLSEERERDGEQLKRAGIAIATAYWLLCGQQMSRAAKLAQSSPGKSEWGPGAMVLIEIYRAWMTEALRRRIHTEAIIDMVVEGQTFDECNKRHWPYLRPGPAKAELVKALKLYTRTRVLDLEKRLRETGDWPMPLTSAAKNG